MAAIIDSKMLDQGSDAYYSDDLRNVLEDHMTYLRTIASTIAMQVTPMQAVKYRMDMGGLLNDLRVPVQLHWVVARMNNFNSLSVVPEDLVQLLVPDVREVAQLMQSHTTTQRLGTS